MKINKPVTNKEYVLEESDSIVSKTDLKGVLTYANNDFIRISGYSLSELIGKSHNILRHPDVPAEFFKDLWISLKEERPWTGIVKNRCKNGDYYWVLANITPFYENDKLVGYMSVRTKATHEQINSTEAVYQLFADGKAGNLKIQDGKVVKSTLMKKLNPFKNLTIKSHLTFVISLLSLLMIVIGGMGLQGMRKSNEGLHSVYEDRTVTMSLLFNISELQRENLILIAGSLVNPNTEVIQKNSTELDQNIAKITKLWNAYLATYLTPMEKILADNFTENRNRFVRKGLRPAMAALRTNDTALANKIRKKDIGPLYRLSNDSIRKLMQLQIDVAKEVYEAAQSRYIKTRNISIGLTLLGIMLALWLGVTLIRAIVRPLDAAIKDFSRISQGYYNNIIEIERNDEIGKVMTAIKAMQIKCGFDVAENNRVARNYKRITIALDNISTAVMIVNNDRNIIFANKSVINLLSKVEGDICQQQPDFSIKNLIGTNFDGFHKSFLHQEQLLSPLTPCYTVNLKLSDLTIILNASPVFTNEGERLGTVIAWHDRSLELAIENQVLTTVNAAIMGDFTKRIEIRNKEGFLKQLVEGLNELLETTKNILNDVQCLMDALSHYDLTVTISNEYSGSFAQTRNDANTTVEKFKESITQIKKAINNFNSEDKKTVSGKGDLLHRTYEHATQVAANTSNIADKGVEVVSQAVLNIDEIYDYSRKISGIIPVINDIVLQTKMLAHTTSIEATRAGEQGGGFAAVAVEMRNLEQRAAAATDKIKNLIDDSLSKVSDGKRLVNQANLNSEEIVTSMHDITIIMSNINNISEAQIADIKQINQAIEKWTI
ncbi:MAG: PAS domain-containing protein [Methyloprofundus sp.]|nr:PAS domain-containing protein [Methyloprofundus sp.]